MPQEKLAALVFIYFELRINLMKIKDYYGQQSYTVSSDLVDVKIAINGAQLTADFDIEGKKINPFYIAPWWNDADKLSLYNTCEYSLRGTFFCFPFGLSKEFKGLQRPAHGFCSARNWDYVSERSENGINSIELSLNIPEENADLSQKVMVKDGQTVVYISTSVKGAVGRYPVGYHPTLRVPEELGSAIIDMSEYKECWTSPTHIDLPENAGYCSLKTDYKIEDETSVPTVYGKNVNLKRHPFIKGFDDIYMYVYDESNEFNYAAVSIPKENYLYFQLKNPKQLSNSMFWSSYCGRHFPKWNSRVNGCLEVGAASNYFFYGITAAYENDPLTEKGYKMYHEFDGSEQDFKLISGVVKIPHDYNGVKSIIRADKDTICIIGRDGSEIFTKCNVDFLK